MGVYFGNHYEKGDIMWYIYLTAYRTQTGLIAYTKSPYILWTLAYTYSFSLILIYIKCKFVPDSSSIKPFC